MAAAPVQVMERWDTIIIGAGSAGMAAAIYAARFNLRTLIIGQEVGGLLNESHNVENYPGFKSIPGLDLMMQFKEHVDNLHVPTVNEWVQSVERKGKHFVVNTDANAYEGRTIIFATGAKHRHLGAKGEDAFAGKGVSYCATCDAAFFRNVPVCVVGGGDAAALAANLLKGFASKVYVIVRKDHMRAEPINKRRLEESEKVEIVYGAEVLEVLGESEVTGVRLNKEVGGSDILPVQGMFVEIGQIIQSELAERLGVQLNAKKEIIINGASETNIPGVYAAGDVGDRAYKQALTGAAEGAVAAFSAYALLQKLDGGEDVDVSY